MHPAFLDNMSWEMAEVYGAISDQIMINLARHFPFYEYVSDVPTSAFAYQAKMLAQMGQVNKETVRIIRSGLENADIALQGVLEQAIIDAVRSAEPELLEGVKKGIFMMPTTPVVSPNQMRAFKLYYEQAANKLNLVNTVMLESTQSAYQQMVSDVVNEFELVERINRTQIALDTAAGETITGVSSWNQALKHATDRLKEGGITGFIDHAGRQWSAEAYVAMDVRTTVFNTGRAAVWETNQDFGNDLYLVSYHNGARPLCYPWQNKVISATNNARTVQDLDGNNIEVIAQSDTSYGEAAGLFGINCKHYPTPFIPGVSLADGKPQDPAENEKTYKESQEQRRLERKIREEKRDLQMMKAQGAPEEQIAKQREKVKQTSADIDDFCKETGRARHRDREAVYTKREFPDKERYDVTQFKKDQKKLIDDYYKNGGEQQGFNFFTEDPETGERKTLTPKVPIVAKPQQSALQIESEVIQSQVATNPLVTQELPNSKIRPRKVAKYETIPTEQEIIDKLGGGDRTKGSCSSLAYAYAGQKGGYDVLDFRGGSSQDFFSRRWLDITKFDGVDGVIVRKVSDFDAAHEIFAKVEAGKEYYFSTGRHAAIIRQWESGLEYLELQSWSKNGWNALDDTVLKKRFAASASNYWRGQPFEHASTLVDIEKFAKSPDFVEMLKYINTASDKQRKGFGGGIK